MDFDFTDWGNGVGVDVDDDAAADDAGTRAAGTGPGVNDFKDDDLGSLAAVIGIGVVGVAVAVAVAVAVDAEDTFTEAEAVVFVFD